MFAFVFALLCFAFGVIGLLKGEIRLTGKNKITGTQARILGAVLIVLGGLFLLLGAR